LACLLLQTFKSLKLEAGHKIVGRVQSVTATLSCNIRIVFEPK
jgi:hypothetical protein